MDYYCSDVQFKCNLVDAVLKIATIAQWGHYFTAFKQDYRFWYDSNSESLYASIFIIVHLKIKDQQ